MISLSTGADPRDEPEHNTMTANNTMTTNETIGQAQIRLATKTANGTVYQLSNRTTGQNQCFKIHGEQAEIWGSDQESTEHTTSDQARAQYKRHLDLGFVPTRW